MRSFCQLFRKHGAQLLGCSTPVQHYPLSTKAENAKAVLQTLNRTHYGDLPNRTKQAFEELCECQNRVLSDPTPENFVQAAEASD